MKLLCIIAAILAFTLAEDTESIADSEAAASIELLKETKETLEPAASAYNYVPENQNSYVAPQNKYVPSENYYAVTSKPQYNVQNEQASSKTSFVAPQNTYVHPQHVGNYGPPPNSYVPPQGGYVPPQGNYVHPQNNYYPGTWYPTTGYPSSTTTTPSPVIKNELIYGDNGSYKYEYKITDGTWVGEEGYFTNPNADDESLVKKGWYSYPGPDGKIYTVSYWADHTGFHAYGDHLPTPPPVPAAIQAALDKKQKEEAEKNKPQTVYYPTQKPIYYPQPTYNPQQPIYNPQPTYRPQTGYYQQPYSQQEYQPSQ